MYSAGLNCSMSISYITMHVHTCIPTSAMKSGHCICSVQSTTCRASSRARQVTRSTECPENVEELGTRTSSAQQCTGNLIRGGRLRPGDDLRTCEKEPLTRSCTAVSLKMLLSIFPFYQTQFPFQDSEERSIWATAEAELAALLLTSECIVSHRLMRGSLNSHRFVLEEDW